MEWKRRLDEEEATVERLEKEVLVRLDTGGKVDTAPGQFNFCVRHVTCCLATMSIELSKVEAKHLRRANVLILLKFFGQTFSLS